MYSDADESSMTAAAADSVQIPAEQPAAVDAVLYNSNTTSVPSYQYDSSGMTELSLVTDEVCHYVLFACEKKLTYLDMLINSKKSCCVRIGPRYDNFCVNIATCDGRSLAWVKEIHYLGIYYQFTYF